MQLGLCVAIVSGPHRTHLGGLVPLNVWGHWNISSFTKYWISYEHWTVWLLTVWSGRWWAVQVGIDEISKLNSTVILICSKLDIIWLLYNGLRWCKGYDIEPRWKIKRVKKWWWFLIILFWVLSWLQKLAEHWLCILSVSDLSVQFSNSFWSVLYSLCWWWGWNVKLVLF